MGCGFHRCKCCNSVNIDKEELKENYTLKEWLGFNFKDYMGAIMAVISEDKFSDLKAKTQEEIKAGRFTDVEVDKLRKVMDKGFREEQSVRQIADKIGKEVKPRDLFRMKDGKIAINKKGQPILQFKGDSRGIIIARTESTRIANLGALEQFKVNNVKEYAWVASFGDRTCPICSDLDGRLFEIGRGPMPPAHVSCRCTIINKLE